MKAEQFLRQGADVLAERGKEYDKPEGERSMARCVAAFNAITGKDLTEAEGWLLLQTLKDVRQWQNPGRYHEDSAVDCVNYSALKAEALSEQGCILGDGSSDTLNFGEPISQENNPIDKLIFMDIPNWKTAPDWANFAAQDLDGKWHWFESTPSVSHQFGKWISDGDKRTEYVGTGKKVKNWVDTLSAYFR